jgi:gliding motility-associated-like protein
LNLTVKATSSSITIVSVCPSELPYSWNGKSYSLGGTYNTTLVNSVGCDSIATLNFSIKSITTSITNVNVCPSQIPYVWNGTSYTNAGVYTVKLINKQGCDSLATINLSVKPLPPAPIATSSTLCQFDKANALSISNPGNYTIIWSNTLSGGISSPSAPIPNTATPGTQTYFVSYANACGESTRVPFVVTVNPAPTVTIAQDELSTVAGVPILINATSPNQNLNILWTPTTGLDNPYTLTPNATLFANQRYIVYVNSLITGCKASDTVLVKVYKDLIVPNIFSPNGDQINDTWMIKYIEQYPTAQVSIFNRYGQFLFTSKDGYKEPWDGTYQGKKVPVGGYFYIIQLTPNSKPISGSLSVVW